ncbi:MAG: replication-associated protein [Cressdnaviricota sp.]|nr:MAG: replication-associated protein [Cressdnaviricota sp.]
MRTVKNAVCGWDVRWNADETTPEEIKETLKDVVKKFVFQKEKGDSGYLHYQGRISLIKKRRNKMKVLELFTIPPNYCEPTTNMEHFKGDAFYQMKKDTRIEGPWTDKDEVRYQTKQLLYFQGLELRPYQQDIVSMSKQFSLRSIDLIWDQTGNIGKSLLSEFMEYEGLAEEVPPFRLMDDIFQWVCSRPIKPSYIFDMPRGMKKDRLGDFYSGIEVIKNGVAYDKRYNAKKIRFDRPRIFVFTNTLPQLSLMSLDRWNIWIVNDEYKLKKWNAESVA